MADVADGLTVNGEPVPTGDLTDAAFARLVSEQAAKTPAAKEPRSPSEPGAFYAQSRAAVEADGDSIRSALMDGDSTDWRDGLTTAATERDKYGRTAAEQREIHEVYSRLDAAGAFDDARRRSEQAAQRREEGERAIEALASSHFFGVWNDPYATEAQRVAAAAELRQKAPNAYARAIQALDEEALADADEWGEDLEDEELPGVQLAEAVERANAQAQLERVTRQQEMLTAHLAAERARVVRQHYERHGVRDDALEEAYIADRGALAALGVDLNTLAPDTTREVLERLHAARTEFALEDRHNAIRAQIAGAELPSVEQGLEVQTPFGLMPLQPQPFPVASRSAAELTERIEARVRAAAQRDKPLRKSAFQRSVLEADSTRWQDGITAGGLSGSRALELADGSRERYEREQAEARAQALSAAG